MQTKAERTKLHILEMVSPIFNKQGYYGTSLAEITQSIGLTKGAVYGNFKSKEHLAVEAFNFNVRRNIFPLSDEINAQTTASAKLKTIPTYYRKYYKKISNLGGCPILNVGIDSNNQNPELAGRVRTVIDKLIGNMAEIIQMGIANGEFKPETNAQSTAKRMYSLIEGAIFTSTMLKDESHLSDMMDYLDQMIDRDLIL